LWHVPSRVINLLSLPSSCLSIWSLGAGDLTLHVESQEFGPWVQNSSFTPTIAYWTKTIFREADLAEVTGKLLRKGFQMKSWHKEDGVGIKLGRDQFCLPSHLHSGCAESSRLCPLVIYMFCSFELESRLSKDASTILVQMSS
jgi:hypothetical protein